MKLSTTIPALPVADVPAAVAFYAERLGFTTVHTDGTFAVVRRDDAVVHLWAAADRGWRLRPPADLAQTPVRTGAEDFLAGTASCRVEVDGPGSAGGVDALHAELAAAGVLHPTDSGAPVDTDFGTREFHVLDLDGNLLGFYCWR